MLIPATKRGAALQPPPALSGGAPPQPLFRKDRGHFYSGNSTRVNVIAQAETDAGFLDFGGRGFRMQAH